MDKKYYIKELKAQKRANRKLADRLAGQNEVLKRMEVILDVADSDQRFKDLVEVELKITSEFIDKKHPLVQSMEWYEGMFEIYQNYYKMAKAKLACGKEK